MGAGGLGPRASREHSTRHTEGDPEMRANKQLKSQVVMKARNLWDQLVPVSHLFYVLGPRPGTVLGRMDPASLLWD